VHVLDAGNIAGRHIISATGHKSESSLKTYTGYTSNKTKKTMSSIVSGSLKSSVPATNRTADVKREVEDLNNNNDTDLPDYQLNTNHLDLVPLTNTNHLDLVPLTNTNHLDLVPLTNTNHLDLVPLTSSQIHFLDAIFTEFDNDTAFDNIACNMDISTPSTVSVPCVQGPNMFMQQKQTMNMSSYTMMNIPAPVIYNSNNKL
jgi:hypothetical protein